MRSPLVITPVVITLVVITLVVITLVVITLGRCRSLRGSAACIDGAVLVLSRCVESLEARLRSYWLWKAGGEAGSGPVVLQVRLLGGVSAVTDQGEPADVGPAKCQALLAALALSAGKAVPVWHLTELIWGEEPPRTADRTMTPSGDTELVVFGLTWAAQRYKLGQDPEAYERLLGRYGEPDHPLMRHARASVYQDYPAMAQWAPSAMAELRRRGDDDLAEQFELDVGAGLALRGHFEEGDAFIAALAGRYRRHGPPTLLHLSLMLLGYSASLQGNDDLAERLFDEAISVEVPERTQSPNRPILARTAFRRGEQSRAFRLLSSYIDELLTTGNMQAICVTCVEFVNMMATLGRLADAAPMRIATSRHQEGLADPLGRVPVEKFLGLGA